MWKMRMLSLIFGLVLIVGIAIYMVRHQQSVKDMERTTRVADAFGSNNIMSRGDYLYVAQMENELRSKRPSDSELTGLISKLTTVVDPVGRACVLGALADAAYLNDDQKVRVCNAVVPILSSGDTLCKKYALSVLDSLADKRYSNQITPMLNDSDPSVKRIAVKTERDISVR